MMKRIGTILAAVVLLCALIAAPTGCGSPGHSGDEGATFRLGSSTAFDTLNPLSSYMQVTYEFFLLVYDPLVRYDEQHQPKPCLATEWSLSPDNLVWTFKLREGVKWHDGQPFTARDVKFTYDLMQASGLGYMYNSYLTGIAKIECPDDHTVVITTESPKANMLMNTIPILPEHIWGKVTKEELETWANDKPIGTGPYRFDSQGDHFVKVARNPDYFGETAPAVESFIFVDYDNTDAMAQALKLGEIDGAVNLNPAQMKQLQSTGDVTVISGEEPGFIQIGVNCWKDAQSKGNPLLLDKAVRQAIERALNKQKILDMAFGGQGLVGTTLINPNDPYHYSPAAGELRDYSAEQANAELEAAGYRDANGDGIREGKAGKPLSFELITIADNVEEVKTGQLIAADLAAVGIQIKNVTMDDGALQDKIAAGSYDMFIWGWGADIDPSVILSILTTAQIGGNNEPHFSNAEYDALYAQQETAMAQAERKKLVDRMQQIAYDEAPYIILVYSNNIQAIRSDKWTGFKQIPEGGMYFFNLTDVNYLGLKPAV